MLKFAYKDEGLRRLLAELSLVKGKPLTEVTRDATRLVALSCMIRTQPFGETLDAKKAGEAAVQRDIRRIYIPVSAMYTQIRAKNGAPLAKAFNSAVKRRDIEEINRVLRVCGLPPMEVGQFDGGKLHAAARNSRGRVRPQAAPSMVVLDPPALRTYERAVMSRVGTAKAGWAQAGQLVSGLTPRSAQWIRRNMSPALAAMEEVTNADMPAFSITSLVPYADAALPYSERSNALKVAQESMKKDAEAKIKNAIDKAKANDH